jgi:N-acyl amino acid synthase of PEP-CTERM/exosortase system
VRERKVSFCHSFQTGPAKSIEDQKLKKRVATSLSKLKTIHSHISANLKKLRNKRKKKQMDELSSFFFSRYSLVVAQNNEDRETCFSTRHEVYCEEMNFEKERSTGLEIDRYDDYSVNCYIKHLPTGDCAGTIRIIMPAIRNQALPLEEKCIHAIEDKALVPAQLGRTSICEISRLAIPKSFRVRQLKAKAPFKPSGKQKVSKAESVLLEHIPYLSLALYFIALSICVEQEMEYAYVLMEPKLARRLKMFGFNFERLGDPIDYNGLRAVYRIKPKSIESELTPALRSFLLRIKNDLAGSLTENMFGASMKVEEEFTASKAA